MLLQNYYRHLIQLIQFLGCSCLIILCSGYQATDESDKVFLTIENNERNQAHFFSFNIENYGLIFWSDLLFGCAVAYIFVIQASILLIFGQPLISKTGQVKFWDGDIRGFQNSQHMTDWYTFTHILHGFILYYASGLVPLAKESVQLRYLLALGGEMGWEVVENSPVVIRRYRQLALAQGYSGDTVINSLCDSVAMSLGFWLASRLHPLKVLALAIAEELIVGAIIRDNLTLNIIQLIHPLKSISEWQSAVHRRSGVVRRMFLVKVVQASV